MIRLTAGVVNVLQVFSEVPMPKSGANCLERLSAAVETVALVAGSSSGTKTLVDSFHLCDETVLGLPGSSSSSATGLDVLLDNFGVVRAGHPTDFFTDVLETLPQVRIVVVVFFEFSCANRITTVITLQENYPYAIGTLPAWPVNATCAIFDAVASSIFGLPVAVLRLLS